MAVAHPVPHDLVSCIGKLTSWIQNILQPSVKEHAKLQSGFQSACKWQVYLVKHQTKPSYSNKPSTWTFKTLVQTEGEFWGTEQHCGISRSCSRKLPPESEAFRCQKMLVATSVCQPLGVNPSLVGWIRPLMATERLWKEKFLFT